MVRVVLIFINNNIIKVRFITEVWWGGVEWRVESYGVRAMFAVRQGRIKLRVEFGERRD